MEIIDASLYSPIYLTLVTILTFVCSINYQENTVGLGGNKNASNQYIGFILAIILSLFIGLRPLSGKYFVDMFNYNENYYAHVYGRDFEFSFNKENFIFDNIFDWLGANCFDISIFFVLIAFIYFFGSYVAINKIFKFESFFAYVIFLGAFSTFSYGTNGIKAGAAAAVFLCAIAFRNQRLMSILLLIISLGMHHSMTVPIVAYICSSLLKDTKYYMVFWVLCLLVASLHILYFQELFAGLTEDESAVNYLTNDNTDWGGKTGFRWDFILYSIFPILINLYLKRKYGVQTTKSYDFILNIYLFTNAIWLLCMYIPFNNRIAYLSWSLYTILLAYPFLNFKRGRVLKRELNTAVWIQLGFTLIMAFI